MMGTPLIKRIVARFVALLDSALSRVYRVQHPGPAERRLLSALGFLVRKCQPNDRWNLHVMIPEWLKGLDVAPLAPLPKTKSIFIFCVYRGVFTTHLVLAVLLAWRGHRITLGYLPKLQSPSKPPMVDHPGVKEYLNAALRNVAALSAGRITCIDLTEEMGSVDIDEDQVQKQAHYDTVMAYQKEGLDLADAAVSALKQHMVDLCIVGNGTTFEGSHACRIMVELGLQVNTTEKFAFRGVRVINHGEQFLNGDDIGAIWNQREQLGYTDEPHLSQFLAKARVSIRERSMNSTETWLWELQRAVGQSEAEALAAAGLPTGKPFVLICPNVVFDAGYGKITNVFPSMKEWMFGTIRFLLANTNHLIVVRAHPGEGLWWGGKEPVHEVLAQQGITQSERLIIIPGQAKVNTYHLMERCLFGIVFSSSTGLEMAVLGKQVVTGGNVIYTKRGFTHDAENQEEYYDNLGRLAEMDVPPPLQESLQRLALLFYFVYHWVAQYPYPYDKPTGIGRLPPRKLLATVDIQPYLPYLDLIAMTKEEFAASLPRYLSADMVLRRLAWQSEMDS